MGGSDAGIASDERRFECFGERHVRGVVGRETVAQREREAEAREILLSVE